MKRIVGLAIMLMMTVAAFAKEVPLQVTETEWGFEISNVNAKRKKIAKTAGFDDSGEYLVLLKNESENFDIEKLADELYYNRLDKQGSVFKIQGNSFIPQKSIAIGRYDISSFDSILIISHKKIEGCVASVYDGILVPQVSLDTLKEENSKLGQLLISKAEEAKLKELIDSSLRNDLYAYQLSKTGNIIIVAYLGKSVDNLEIPEKIEGLPVEKIYSMKSQSKKSFKNVTIPKSVKSIADDAFSNCGIENLTFAKGSQIEEIGTNAFNYNNIKELNLPKQKISIGFDAFSHNKIKEVSIYKDWSFSYHTPFGYFNVEKCKEQKDNAFILSDELEEVFFEEGCTFICPHIFANCKKLKKLSIPATMKKFGAYAFANCESLSEIIFAGVPIAEVDKLDDLIKKADANLKKNSVKYDVAGDIMNAFAAAATIRNDLRTNPASAIGCFEKCPIPLKTKSILLKMGLPDYAF